MRCWLALCFACTPACTGNLGEAPPQEAALTIAEAWRWEARRGSASVALIDLGGASLDVVVGNPARFEVDVFAAANGNWSLAGSTFAGATGPTEVLGGRVAGGPVVLARLGEKEVTLLAGVPGEPHRLRFPVSVYRGRGTLRDIDVADVDADGDDELLVAGQLGVAVVELVPALDAHPEKPPALSSTETLLEGVDAAAVGAADIDGDGTIEIVASLHGEPLARVYGAETTTDVALVALADHVARTACPGRGATLGLVGGARRQLEPSADGYRLVPMHAAESLVSSGRHVATLSGDEITLRRPCGEAQGAFEAAGDVFDLADRDNDAPWLAMLDAPANELVLYEVRGP